jgi:hypothetical protein
MNKPSRIPISPEVTKMVMAVFEDRLALAYKKHGQGACWSMQEAFGMIDEEVDEVKEEMHTNNVPKFFLESIDVMIAGFWAAASVKSGVIDGKWDDK